MNNLPDTLYASDYFQVNAMQYLVGQNHTCHQLEQFLGWDKGSGTVCKEDGSDCSGIASAWLIHTDNGELEVDHTDWVIRFGGTYFSLSDVLFREIFEPARIVAGRRWMLEDIEYAWTNEGPYPKIHHKAKHKLKKMWPRLHDALERMYG